MFKFYLNILFRGPLFTLAAKLFFVMATLFFRKTFKSHLRCTATLCIICVYKSGDFPGKTPLVSSLAYYTYVCIMAKHLCVCVMHLIRPSKLLFISCFLRSFTLSLTHTLWMVYLFFTLSLFLMESVFMKCSYLTTANIVVTFPTKNLKWIFNQTVEFAFSRLVN